MIWKNYAAERAVLHATRATRRFEEGAISESLPELRKARDEIELAIAGSVVRARQLGRSWAEIARPLGITKQAAQKRYAAYQLPPMTTTYQEPVN